ncbi:MAG: dual specificity protein phosphatase [bacterium]
MTDQFVLIKEIHPPLGSSRTLYMLEPFGVIVKVASRSSPQNLTAEIWTNVIDKLSPDGVWHGVPMYLNSRHSAGILEFHGSFMPTDQGRFEYTVRIGLKRSGQYYPSQWQWAGAYGQNGSLTVLPPSPEMQWTQGPQAEEIAPGVFVGNLIAASKAPELGFQAVLNMAEELNIGFPSGGVEYKKIALADGAHNPIPPEKILDAVSWIQQQVKKGHKVCVNCRAGIGRSGSIGIAYLYASNPAWPYSRALQAAWDKKPNIYPHKNLQETLEALFPRKPKEHTLSSHENPSGLSSSGQIQWVKYVDFQPGQHIEISRYQPLIIRIRIKAADADHQALVTLRTNLNQDPFEEVELYNSRGDGIYEGQIQAKRGGEYWLTASASLHEKLPDNERSWAGDNLIIRVR